MTKEWLKVGLTVLLMNLLALHAFAAQVPSAFEGSLKPSASLKTKEDARTMIKSLTKPPSAKIPSINS